MVRVLIADDHECPRRGLACLLEETGFDVAGLATNGQEAVAMAKRLGPDVIVLDINMPGMDGVAATRQILSDRPEVRIVGFTMSDDPCLFQKMLDAGASACISKADPVSDLLAAIRGK